MFRAKAAFSGFSVDNLAEAKDFYTQKLGLKAIDQAMGLRLSLPGGGELFIYEKPDHQAATYTMLNFVVENIDEAVGALTAEGITFEKYDNMPMHQDEKGIARGLAAHQGPDIAWFKDPAGNVIAILQSN